MNVCCAEALFVELLPAASELLRVRRHLVSRLLVDIIEELEHVTARLGTASASGGVEGGGAGCDEA